MNTNKIIEESKGEMEKNKPDTKPPQLNHDSILYSGPDPSNLVKPCDYLVGKRILCSPQTFQALTPSPIQISSSLWSPRTLGAMKDLPHRKPALCWCPKHHHHQATQQRFIDEINECQANKTTSSPNLQPSINLKRSTKRQSVGPVCGSQTSSQSYSVIRSNCEQMKRNLDNLYQNPDKEAHEHDKNKYLVCYKFNQVCELCDTTGDLSMGQKSPKPTHKVQMSNLAWQLGTIKAVSHRDMNDKSTSVMIEFDLVDWKARDWYHIHDRIVDQDTCEQVEMIQERAVDSSSTQRGQKQDDGSQVDADMTTGVIKKVKTLSGAFSVLLVETSICCVKRRFSPAGKDKLWPALVFEPLVDKLGLFDNEDSKQVIAVEYFDLLSENTSLMKLTCDKSSMISELETNFFSVSEQQSIAMLKNNMQPVTCPDGTEYSDCPKDINQGCACWSPRVEFVPSQQIYKFDQQIDSRKMSKFLLNGPEQGFEEPSGQVSKETFIDGSNLSSFKRFLQFFHHVHLLNSDRSKLNNYDPDNAQAINTKFKDLSFEKKVEALAVTNDLLGAFIQYPTLYYSLKQWHNYRDAQSILTNVYTAAHLVGNRVRVYRKSGTTQWFTAVIIGYDEQQQLLTLIDDTVLEEHHEDPRLLEIHLMDHRLVQSLIEGDIDSRDGAGIPRRRTQRNTIKAPRSAGNNLSTLSSSSSGARQLQPSTTANNKPHQAKGLSIMQQSSLQPSSISSSVLPNQQLPSATGSQSKAATETSQSSSSSNCHDSATNTDSGSGTGGQKRGSLSATRRNCKAAKGEGSAFGKLKMSRKLSLQAQQKQTMSFLMNDSVLNNEPKASWTNRDQKSSDSLEVEVEEEDGEHSRMDSCFKRRLKATINGSCSEPGSSSSSGGLGTGANKSAAASAEFLSPMLTTTTASASPNRAKLSLSRGATLDGKNFLSHRLRLEALEQRAALDDAHEMQFQLSKSQHQQQRRKSSLNEAEKKVQELVSTSFPFHNPNSSSISSEMSTLSSTLLLSSSSSCCSSSVLMPSKSAAGSQDYTLRSLDKGNHSGDHVDTTSGADRDAARGTNENGKEASTIHSTAFQSLP